MCLCDCFFKTLASKMQVSKVIWRYFFTYFYFYLQLISSNFNNWATIFLTRCEPWSKFDKIHTEEFSSTQNWSVEKICFPYVHKSSGDCFSQKHWRHKPMLCEAHPFASPVKVNPQAYKPYQTIILRLT